MIVGDHFTFDIGLRELHDAEWIVLELTDEAGHRVGCRWHKDATRREISVSLHALAETLDPV